MVTYASEGATYGALPELLARERVPHVGLGSAAVVAKWCDWQFYR